MEHASSHQKTLFLEDCMLVEMHSYSVVMLPFATDAAKWYSLFAAHLRKYQPKHATAHRKRASNAVLAALVFSGRQKGAEWKLFRGLFRACRPLIDHTNCFSVASH
jgi:hypothetical protein